MQNFPSLKKEIFTLNNTSNSVSKFACEVQRSLKVILNFLSNQTTYETKKSSGRPESLTLKSEFLTPFKIHRLVFVK